MTNIILICRDRPRLTEQTLRTLYMHTDAAQFNLTIVNDGSAIETTKLLEQYARKDNCEVVHILKPVGIVGFLKNVGAWTSERVFGRGDYLCFIDNDIAFTRNWLPFMVGMYAYTGVGVLGGYQHPYHQTIEIAHYSSWGQVNKTDAVAGYHMLMYWSVWDDFGPFDANAQGVCQSEDYAFCRRIVSAGGFVGYSDSPLVHNCGITNSEGKPAIGAEHFPRIRGLIYE